MHLMIFPAFLILLFNSPATSAPGRGNLTYLIPASLSTPDVYRHEASSHLNESPRILFWNMRWFPAQPGDDPSSPEANKKIRASAQLLRESDADLVLLCEVRDLESLTKMKLPYGYQACTAIERHPADDSGLPPQNLALLSRAAPDRVWALDFEKLPDTADRPSRGILGAQFKLSSGELLTCYTLHLKSNLGGYRGTALRRERTIDYLARDLQRLNLDPQRDLILIAGDMNTSPHDPLFRDEKTLSRLSEMGFERAGKKSTALDGEPDARDRGRFNDFDHLYLSRALYLQMIPNGNNPQITTRNLPAGKLSDHDMIEIQINRPDYRQSTP